MFKFKAYYKSCSNVIYFSRRSNEKFLTSKGRHAIFKYAFCTFSETRKVVLFESKSIVFPISSTI